MRQMQSITLIRSLTIGDKTPRMNQGLADQNKSGPEHIDLLIINKFSNLNIIVAAALDFLVFDWQLIVNHGSFPLLLSWLVLVSYYYCLTHWLRICCDKQLSKMPRPGLRLLFVNLWGTGPLFDSLACVFDTVCIIIGGSHRTWNLFDLFVDNWILIPSIKSAAGIIFNSTLHSTGSTIASLSVSYCILSKQQQQPKVLLDWFQSEPLQFKFSQWVEVDFKFKWSLISCVIFRTDQNRSPWRRSNQNQNQRRKLWSSRNGAIHSTLCTYRTQFGHWTESWLKTTSVTSCDQCWWQQWEWNLWRILICHFAMSYNGTGNQDGGSCGWQWAPKGILSRVKRLNWLCFAHTAKQKLRFG